MCVLKMFDPFLFGMDFLNCLTLPCSLKDITMMGQTLERLFEQKVLAMPKEVSPTIVHFVL